MVDDNDDKPRGAAARKVPAGGTDAAGDGATSDGDATPTRRPRRKRPFWRKGWFWVGVIVAEVAVALVLSFVLERSTTEVDVTGGDLAAFCDQARALRDQVAATATAEGENESVTDPTRFEQERDAYLALVATAPPALVADLEDLAARNDDIIVVVRENAERRAADPSFSGLNELSRALQRASEEGRVAAARVNLVLREECGIDRAASTTTTAPPTPVVPGSTPG